jgi:uncharacterized protein (TIGR02246 family)
VTVFARPRDVVDAFAESFNAKDAEALGQLFTDDAEFVNIRGMRMRRREWIVAGHAHAFAGPLLGTAITFDAVDEMQVTGDVVVLHVHCVRRKLPDAPAHTPVGPSVLTFVTRRSPEGWQAVAAANVEEAPPPPSP